MNDPGRPSPSYDPEETASMNLRVLHQDASDGRLQALGDERESGGCRPLGGYVHYLHYEQRALTS